MPSCILSARDVKIKRRKGLTLMELTVSEDSDNNT